jgi:hypothetical protein
VNGVGLAVGVGFKPNCLVAPPTSPSPRPDLAAISEVLPRGGFGARYAEGHVPTWI